MFGSDIIFVLSRVYYRCLHQPSKENLSVSFIQNCLKFVSRSKGSSDYRSAKKRKQPQDHFPHFSDICEKFCDHASDTLCPGEYKKYEKRVKQHKPSGEWGHSLTAMPHCIQNPKWYWFLGVLSNFR